MPIYEYQCKSCGLKFEELKGLNEESSVVPCHRCKTDAQKTVSAAAMVVAGGTSNETVDMTIGREANNRWQQYHDRQTTRRGDKELKPMDLPKAPDGKFMPIMGLGNKDDVGNRKEYVSALQDHRKTRTEKGVAQFSEPGAF